MPPTNPLETTLNSAELTAIAILAWSYGLWFLITRLRRTRPGLAVGRQVAVGFALRLIAIAAVTATGLGSTLRGGDETTFLDQAHLVAASNFSSNLWLPGGGYPLHVILFALQLRLGDFGPGTIRITQVGLAMLGTTLIIVTVHDIAGTYAARITGWLVALEPSSIFFSELIHKESLMILASGLVAFGGSKTWVRIGPAGLLTMLAGSLIAVATRPYAGWFLSSAAVLLALHSGLRNASDQPARALPVVLGVAVIIFIATPAILATTSPSSLKANLQGSQNANVSAAGSPGNNLALEQVNFSTRGAIVTNLPQRIWDLLARPYPWQIGSTSQRIGVVGTLIALVVLGSLARLTLRARSAVVGIAAPLIYPAFFLMLAYALSVGNAGTGFRYRTQLVTLAIGTLMVLRSRLSATRPLRSDIRFPPTAVSHPRVGTLDPGS